LVNVYPFNIGVCLSIGEFLNGVASKGCFRATLLIFTKIKAEDGVDYAAGLDLSDEAWETLATDHSGT